MVEGSALGPLTSLLGNDPVHVELRSQSWGNQMGELPGLFGVPL